ncbi:MAG TPA: hypothetical protein VEU08_04185, partial [Vicinamibacterales bacterium]|nr:hypothetical protein [Vicinamibacterales bacterium]
RAERVPFPTLRFIQPSRLAAMRRHLLADLPLLAVRLLILACAAAALAGPLVVTPRRAAAWNARLQSVVVEGPELSAGLRRATKTLLSAPPGRREIVVRSTFPIGSLTAEDILNVPRDVGLRFERNGALPQSRAVNMPSILTDSGPRARTLTLDRSTTMTEMHAGQAFRLASFWPAGSTSADPSLNVALSEHVLAPIEGRRIRVIFAGDPDFEKTIASASAVTQAWMADGLASIARDSDLRIVAHEAAAGVNDERLTKSPWLPLAVALDGRPFAVGTSAGGALTLITAAPPASLAAAIITRDALNTIGDRRVPVEAETLTIHDSQLQAWTRGPGPPPPPRLETVGTDDRRWLWIAVLMLRGLETWLRSRRGTERAGSAEREESRVA